MANTAVMDSISFPFSVFANISMSGREAIATTHAYTVMSSPACDSVILKSVAMSERRPIGMNSEVLKMKAENVSPMTGIHALIPFQLSVFTLSVSMAYFKNRRQIYKEAMSGANEFLQRK